MQIEVTQNAKRNIIIGFLNKLILMFLPFVVKALINNYFGTEYLGLNSLYSSILQVLTLSELGLSSALVYHMYKPIAENNHRLINALLNLYKKAYKVIGIVILTIGLLLIPFLPLLIKNGYPAGINIFTIYLIQLTNTVISYFLFAYKQSLLVAYQREDINSIINLFTQAGLQIIQVVILLLTKNYYLYILMMPIFTVINNIWIGIVTKKMFPQVEAYGKLEPLLLSDIKKLVIGTFIQKACAITRNALDSICISSFIGLTLTGIYNNYYTIFSGLLVLLGIISTSLAGGVGNHVALKSADDNFDELIRLDFLYMGISCWCTVCLLCIYQPFMQLWMGADMTLPLSVIVLICIYFYVLKMGDMRSIYSAANGLWWKMKYRSIVETIGNVFLNIVLGKFYGIHGIVLATIISLFLCNFIWSSTILFNEYFKGDKIKQYFIYHFKYAIITFIIAIISFYICNIINFKSLSLSIIVRGVICTLVFSLIYLILFAKSNILKESLKMIKK